MRRPWRRWQVVSESWEVVSVSGPPTFGVKAAWVTYPTRIYSLTERGALSQMRMCELFSGAGSLRSVLRWDVRRLA